MTVEAGQRLLCFLDDMVGTRRLELLSPVVSSSAFGEYKRVSMHKVGPEWASKHGSPDASYYLFPKKD